MTTRQVVTKEAGNQNDGEINTSFLFFYLLQKKQTDTTINTNVMI